MKKIILLIILALTTSFSFAATPDSLKKDLEDLVVTKIMAIFALSYS